MAVFNKFNSFVAAIGQEIHQLNTDALMIMLTNSAPSANNTIKANITEITAEHGYSAGGTRATTEVYVQVGGVAKLTADDVVFTASGGTIGPFRYAVMYNDTAANDELIGWWDYGANLTLQDGETFTVDFNATTGILTVT